MSPIVRRPYLAAGIVTAALALGSCGGGSAGAPAARSSAPVTAPAEGSGPATTPPSAPGAPGTSTSAPGSASDVHRLDVTVSGGKVSGVDRRVSVREGEQVRLTVTSDVPDTVHVHGYDLEADVAPGRPAVLQFGADRTGLFEIETHETGTVLFQLLVR